MTEHKLWYGFLEAEDRSSPVIVDRSMDTGEKRSVYIYNHNKKEILKYVRELAEPKLRELTDQEQTLKASMKSGFTESLKKFKHNVLKLADKPAKAPSRPSATEAPDELESDAREPGEEVWEDDSDD